MLGRAVFVGLNLPNDRISRISASLLAAGTLQAQKHGQSQLFIWLKWIHLSKLSLDSGHGFRPNYCITPKNGQHTSITILMFSNFIKQRPLIRFCMKPGGALYGTYMVKWPFLTEMCLLHILEWFT